MRAVIAVPVIMVVATLVSIAYGESQPARPPGVSAENWIPLSKTAGFVVIGDAESKPSRDGVQPRPLPLQGYLVAQQSGTWRRLEYALVPREDFRVIPVPEGR